jgi:carboxypeptidase Taq
MSNRYDAFVRKIQDIHHLVGASSLLAWDQEVFLPPKGVGARALQKATLAAFIHQKICDPSLGDLLEALQQEDLAPVPAANVREFKRDRDRAVKIPSDLVRQLAEETSLAQQAWAQAKNRDEWPLFAPHLEKLVALKRREADAVGYAGEPYNALLDEYEPGTRVEDLAVLFAALKGELEALLEKIAAAGKTPGDSLLRREYPVAQQDRLGREVLQRIGFDFEAGRLDTSAHPFTQGISIEDVRITTRYDENNLAVGLYANLHEGGHALYEMGLPTEHEGTPVAAAVSLGIHESQSRLWENSVGRSRDFLTFVLPRLRELFPQQLSDTTPDQMYRAVNVVRPSVIRIEADEVTYNLHIILRLEIERGLINDEVSVAELPGLWREKMRQSLGCEPSSDAEGVLQDIHWAFGAFGYFPTYTLGNLYAAQIYRQAGKELSGLSEQIAQGDFGPLLDWLRRRIHRQGSLLLAADLCRQVTGEDLSIEPFIGYLRAKFGDIYGF